MNLELADGHADPEYRQADAGEVQPYRQGQAEPGFVQAQGLEKAITVHPAEAVEGADGLLPEIRKPGKVWVEPTYPMDAKVDSVETAGDEKQHPDEDQ
ncbi:hypothetical protein OF113_04455 [Ectopseudomonas chengduensis]|nr:MULTISPECIES: hypothetical protein [Pseudomonas]MBA4682714.1 hypothetical protein [Pseudomonas sp.]MDZ4193056.1 hypothetical protein [Pseudomonas sp.]UZT79316.1 hypothetical protein OF113_04455 [Pseudomonas chengduensis]